MTPFPQKSVDIVRSEVDGIKKYHGKKQGLVAAARHITRWFQHSYGFYDHLKTGNYAPFPHERKEESIYDYNCTTVITPLFLYCQEYKLKPEIVQFLGFREIKEKKDYDKPNLNSHYALFVD